MNLWGEYMPSVTANIQYSGKIDDKILYQFIYIIPDKKSNLKYFLNDKYIIGRTIDDFLSEIYYGDGVNIIFSSKNIFRNKILIKYDIINNIDIDLSEKDIYIKTKYPKFDGCQFCIYNKKIKNSVFCSYYKKVLQKDKKYCIDFVENER